MSGHYHLSATVISRGKGQSAVACAAYRSGTELADHRYGKTHDYGRKSGVIESGILSPDGSPAWIANREALWNEIERREKRKDAQLAREFNLAFPHQLDAADRKEILERFIKQEFTEKGFVADWAIHKPNRQGNERNYHAHVMVSLRPVEGVGFSANKPRELNKTEQLVEWRKAWADVQNEMLARRKVLDANGKLVQVDYRSYESQGIKVEPTMHLGAHATAMERRGLQTELGDLNRDILARNAALFSAKTIEGSPQRSKEEEARLELIRKALEDQAKKASDHNPEPGR